MIKKIVVEYMLQKRSEGAEEIYLDDIVLDLCIDPVQANIVLEGLPPLKYLKEEDINAIW